MDIKTGRTDAYVCSLDPMSVNDMFVLETIRATIKASNKNAPRVYTKYGSSYIARKRVTVKGRKPRYKQWVNFARWGGPADMRCRAHNYFGDIVGGIANATEYDIYIHEDRRDWEYS
jgi:hypothetical protein